MNIKTIRPVTAFLALLFAASAAHAQVEISGIGWEVSKLRGKERSPYEKVASLRASPEVRFTDRLRALVTLRNPSGKIVEGLVMRYALSLRLQKQGGAPESAFWSVPFFVEEVRVSMIKPSSSRQARVIRFELQNQLNKLRNSGFTPTALRLEVMLDPRQGDEPAAIKSEAVIDIVKP